VTRTRRRSRAARSGGGGSTDATSSSRTDRSPRFIRSRTAGVRASGSKSSRIMAATTIAITSRGGERRMDFKRSRLASPGGVDDCLGIHASSAVLVAGVGAVAGTRDAHHVVVVVTLDLVIESIFVAFVLRDGRHVVGITTRRRRSGAHAARDGGFGA
jgi:hypothetical protein